MTNEPLPVLPGPVQEQPGDRLDSWKEVAGYLSRDVSTVQRWEKRERMPVHRHVHDKLGSVYAFRSELDAWWHGRGARLIGQEPRDGTQESAPGSQQEQESPGGVPEVAAVRPRTAMWFRAGLGAVVGFAIVASVVLL